jgi:hypothetical protein
LAAGAESKLDVPDAGDSEAAAFGVPCQRASVADLLMEFVDGHGWCRLTAGTYPPVAEVQQEKARPRKISRAGERSPQRKS